MMDIVALRSSRVTAYRHDGRNTVRNAGDRGQTPARKSASWLLVRSAKHVPAPVVREQEETVKCVLTAMTVAFAVWTASSSAQDTAAGAKVYADQKCGICHSIAGKGNAKGSLDGVGGKLTVDEIRRWIVDPAGMTAKTNAPRKPPMPAKYRSLSKGDLDALVAYLASLK
jgi:mono/diheme cytochrome c family protein